MALTYAMCKAATDNNGNGVTDRLLFTSGFNGTVQPGSLNNGKLEFALFWTIHNWVESKGTFDCTLYVFGRKANAYSSTNDFTLKFGYRGYTYTTTRNLTLNTSSGKVRFMGSHTFEGLIDDVTQNSSAYVTITGASGTSDASGTWTLKRDLLFERNMSSSAEVLSTTSLKLTLNGMTPNRGFYYYLPWEIKKDSESSYKIVDYTNVGRNSTATSLSGTFTGLTPCTAYDLRTRLGFQNYDNADYDRKAEWGDTTYYQTLYTNALTASAPTVANKVYNGSAQTGVSGGTGVTLGGTRSATNVGEYEATATPTAQYNWTSAGVAQSSKTVKKYTWKITPKTMTASNMTVTLSATSLTYNGAAQKPTVTVKDNARNVNLVNGTDYTVSYSSDVTNIGTKTITITGKGNYSGSFTVTYSIVAKGMTASNMTTTLSAVSYTYDGTAKKPTVTVKDNARNVNLVNGTDYTVTYPVSYTHLTLPTIA